MCSKCNNLENLVLEVPTDLLKKYLSYRDEAERLHRRLVDEIATANNEIYSAFENVEGTHRDIEDAVSNMNEVALSIHRALRAAAAKAGAEDDDALYDVRPDLAAFVESWEIEASIDELDFNTEIEEPQLTFGKLFTQAETPAEKTLQAQIRELQKALETLQRSRVA